MLSVSRQFSEFQRLLVVGDVHANTGFLLSCLDRASEEGLDAVVQVGDFGFWPRTSSGQAFLRKVGRRSRELGVPVFFCDGNHEDHERLPHHESSPVEVVSGVFFVPRGTTVFFGARRFLFFGGAVSVDQGWRTPGRDWFSNEVASREEWERAMSAGPVDVVVAHDVPDGVPLDLHMVISESLERACAQHRESLGILADEVSPSLWLAGHYHQRRSEVRGRTRVEVFGCEWPLEASAGILDLDSLELRPLPVRI